MRTLSELAPLRRELRHNLAWSVLLSLHADAPDTGGPFQRSVFDVGWQSDVPPARVRPILTELVDIGAITATPVRDERTFEITVQ